MIQVRNRPRHSAAWPANWREDWRYWNLFDRFKWEYGHDRAMAIVRGEDAATRKDLAAWRRVGAVKK